MPEALAPGAAAGEAVVLTEPISFWGGVEPDAGRVVDPRHPQHGRTLRGAVLVMPEGRGSSSSSTVLAECVRLGTAPAAILLGVADPILAIGSIVARELYGVAVPVVVDPQGWADIRDGDAVAVEADEDGSATISVRAGRRP